MQRKNWEKTVTDSEASDNVMAFLIHCFEFESAHHQLLHSQAASLWPLLLSTNFVPLLDNRQKNKIISIISYCIALAGMSRTIGVRISVRKNAFVTSSNYRVGKIKATKKETYKFTRDCVERQSWPATIWWEFGVDRKQPSYFRYSFTKVWGSRCGASWSENGILKDRRAGNGTYPENFRVWSFHTVFSHGISIVQTIQHYIIWGIGF